LDDTGEASDLKKKRTPEFIFFELEGLSLQCFAKTFSEQRIGPRGNFDVQFLGLVPQNNFL